MLLDAVSATVLAPRYHIRLSASFSLSPDRVFSGSLASAILSLASPAYVQLSNEFRVSVDQVASSFSAAYLGNGIILQVLLMLTQPITSNLLTS